MVWVGVLCMDNKTETGSGSYRYWPLTMPAGILSFNHHKQFSVLTVYLPQIGQFLLFISIKEISYKFVILG